MEKKLYLGINKHNKYDESEIDQYREIKKLTIGSGGKIPKNISEMRDIEEFKISSANIYDIPREVVEINSLKTLRITLILQVVPSKVQPHL